MSHPPRFIHNSEVHSPSPRTPLVHDNQLVSSFRYSESINPLAKPSDIMSSPCDSAPSYNSNIFSNQQIRTRQLASQRRRILSGCRLGHTFVTRLFISRQSITTLSCSSVFSIPPESPARVLTFGPESKSLPLLSLIDTRGWIPSLSSSRSVAVGGGGVPLSSRHQYAAYRP